MYGGSYNESYDDRNIENLKPFSYETTYSDNPQNGQGLGIFDVAAGEKDIWQEGEEEKRSYRKTFEKHLQDAFSSKSQSTISQRLITKLLLMSAVSFILTFFIVGKVFLVIASFGRSFHIQNSFGILSVPYQLMSGSMGVFMLVLILSFAAGAYTWMRYVKKISRFDDRKEARGSRPAYINYDMKKCKKTFEIRELDEPVGIPLGVFRDMVYCMPENPRHDQFRNKNIMYIGGSGSGKSYAGVEPLILQCIARNESFIVSDTKGALYKNLAKCCERMGYDVKMFSTKSFTKSDSWNCFYDIVHSTEQDSWDKIDDFAHTMIKNSKRPGDKGDQYWDNNEQDLLRALVHYVCKSKMFPDDSNRTFSALMDLINGSIEDIDQIFKSLPSNESAYDASSSFRNLNNIDLKEKYRSGLANKLQIFKNTFVKSAMSYDGINIEESVHKPTAIFLVSADDRETYDAVTSLFVTSAYMKLIEIADSDNYNNGALYKPYWFIMDELCNMAAINDLSRKISTNRSRNINFALTIQSISQIEERYGRLFENIAANCGTIVPVGVFDDTTAKFIANKCGTFSEMSFADMTKKPTFFSKYVIPFHKTERVQIMESKVLTEFNIKNSLDGDVLALIAGKELFRGHAYGADMHPLYKYCATVRIDEREPEWFLKFLKEHPDKQYKESIEYTPSRYELTPSQIRYSIPEPDDISDTVDECAHKTDFSKFMEMDEDLTKEAVTQKAEKSTPQKPENSTVFAKSRQKGENFKDTEEFSAFQGMEEEDEKEISVFQDEKEFSGFEERQAKQRRFEQHPMKSSEVPPDILHAEDINKPVKRQKSTENFEEQRKESKSTQEFYDEVNSMESFTETDFSDLEQLIMEDGER